MKIKIKLIPILILSFLLSKGVAQTNPGLSFGGSTDDKGLAICSAGDGGYLLSGSTRSFGSGSEDYFLIKLNENFQQVWSKTYGGVHQDHSRSIIPTDEGFVIFGDVWDYGDPRLGMYLSMFDPDGDKLWGHHYGTNMDDWGFKVIEASNGDFMLLGYSRGFEVSGDIYLLRTDHQGNLLWENTYGYNRDDYAMDIIENDDNTFFDFRN